MIRLRVMPEETLIVEDSEKGRLAAEASGAHLLMVAGPHEVAPRVRRCIEELHGIRLPEARAFA